MAAEGPPLSFFLQSPPHCCRRCRYPGRRCSPSQTPIPPSTSHTRYSSHPSSAHPFSTRSQHTLFTLEKCETRTFPFTTTSSPSPALQQPTSLPFLQTPFRNTMPRKSVLTITQSLTSQSFSWLFRTLLLSTRLFSSDPRDTELPLTTESLACERVIVLCSVTVVFERSTRRSRETLSSVLLVAVTDRARGTFESELDVMVAL